MRATRSVIYAVVIMGLASASHANTIYNINIADGGNSLTGTITTDGMLGEINNYNIVDWSITVAGPYNFTLDSATSVFGCNSVCGLEATADVLILFPSTGPGDIGFHVYGINNAYIAISPRFGNAYQVLFTPNNAPGGPQAASINGVIASGGNSFGVAAAVPEPEAWGLMMSGLVLVGAAARRRRV
ncbi:MAG: PEP-CTERM sorting domain-containing protein [Thiobacillus sp.]